MTPVRDFAGQSLWHDFVSWVLIALLITPLIVSAFLLEAMREQASPSQPPCTCTCIAPTVPTK